ADSTAAAGRRGARAGSDERDDHRGAHLRRWILLGKSHHRDSARDCRPLGAHTRRQVRPPTEPDLRPPRPLSVLLRGPAADRSSACMGLSLGGGLTVAVFTPKSKGLADLVNYAALVDDGVCLLKDGGFLAAWTYTGPDLESASHDELAVLSSQVNAALVRLGNGWMLHVDAIRRPSVGYPEGGAFPDSTTRLIDDERRERYTAEGTHFESAYYVALTYRPPAEIENRVSALFLE